MKTRSFMAALLLLSVLMARAQREVGSFTLQPKVGVNVSNITDNPAIGAHVLTYKPDAAGNDFMFRPLEDNVNMTSVGFTGIKEKIGWVAGVEAEYQLTKRLGLSMGLLYSMQGAKYDDCYGTDIDITDAKIRLEYINVPIMANYYIVKGLALKAGIQPAFCVKDEAVGDVTVRAEEGWNVYNKEVVMPDASTFDLSVPVGISYEYRDFVVGAMYNIGVTNVFGGDWDGGGIPSAHNSVLQFTIGYKIGL